MTVLLTGATGGIGQETARLFAHEGYNLALGYHANEAGAKALADELTRDYGVWAVPIRLDLEDKAQLSAAIEWVQATMGRISILVNNAAISLVKPIEETTSEEWDKVIAVDLTGAFWACKCVLPSMREGGAIVNVSSMWGSLGASCEVAYAAAKGGLEAMTKSLAKEYPDVRIGAVSLGWVDTPMNARFDEADKQAFFAQNPTMHVLSPRDAAEAILRAIRGEESGQVFRLGW